MAGLLLVFATTDPDFAAVEPVNKPALDKN
jgi:hypothetical protein